MGKTAENIEYYLNTANDKDYLQDLLFNIKEVYENKESLTFQLIEPKEKGFSAKIGGLFAYISYYHFGWSYPNLEFWKNVSNSLRGKYFIGKIHSLAESPIFIQIDAKDQVFAKPNLEKFAEYRGVIAKKSKYGAFIDLGLHFNWEFGSLLGLLSKSNFLNQSDYDNLNVGEQITTVFQDYNETGKLLLVHSEHGKWINGEMEKLIGTVQKVRVIITENGKYEFYVLGEHKAVIPTYKNYYPNFQPTAKNYVRKLNNGETIECEVLNINKHQNRFVLKLLIENQTE